MKVSTYTALDDVIKMLDRFVVEKTAIQNSVWDLNKTEPNVGVSVHYIDELFTMNYSDISSSPKFDFQVNPKSISLHIGNRDIFLSGIKSMKVEEIEYNNEEYIKEITLNLIDEKFCVYIMQTYFLEDE